MRRRVDCDDEDVKIAEPVISVRHLVKVYGGFEALAGIDFDVRSGEVLALLGPNGAGKSTTIEILEGYRRRSAGKVSVLGTDPARAGRAWRASVGIVLQSSGIPEAATVSEIVRHFATFYPHPRNPEETIDAVGLSDKSRVRVAALSGGQRRRLDVALGIIGRPKILFLDEPTTGFDPEARRAFWTLIERIRDEGTTILLTTHYLDEAARLADRAIVIARGRVVAAGPIDEIGGRDARTPHVRWMHSSSDIQMFRSRTPAQDVAELYAAEGEPASLEVIRPSLENVYLELVAATPSRSAAPSTPGRGEASC